MTPQVATTLDAQTLIAQAIAQTIAPRKPLSVSQWADQRRVLSRKDSAEPGQWRTSRNPPLREPMDCLSSRSGVRKVALKFPVQFGKALSLDTPLPTPNGWTTMGEIKVGDRVFGTRGQSVSVIAKSEVFTDHDCYVVEFSDGGRIIADAGHRWSVIDKQTRSEARKEIKRRRKRGPSGYTRKPVDGSNAAHTKVVDTEVLFATFRYHGKQSRYAIPVADALNLRHRSLPMDPYVLGVWLGDGTAASGSMTLHEDDAPFIVERIESAGHHCRVTPDQGQRSVTVIVDGRDHATPTFRSRLDALDLLNNKHIPSMYLRASRKQRLALLQGLMDTDGYASRNNAAEITSSCPALADSIVELVRTLGIKPAYRWRETSRRDSMRITFDATSTAVFSLPRKADRIGAAGPRVADIARVRHVVNVERVETVPTRCIAVDSPDHLFLAGESMIPTHNTSVALNVLGYILDHAPGPVMVALPTDVSREKWVVQKLNPMLDETPSAKRALTSLASRDSANQRYFKDFAGGQLYLEHAGSPARLKSTTVRYMLVDEVDEFAGQLRSGDDPIDLLDGRTSSFPATSKQLYISTPGIQGLSRIDALYEASDQRRYYVPCPDCGHEQPLEWAGMHWNSDGTECWYACRECGVCIDERHKTSMIAAGRWVAENPGAKTRGYTLNGLYYPIGLGPRWLDLVDKWRNAQNDPARLKTFINDRLAESWEDPAMRSVKHNVIRDRAEQYPLRWAPSGVLVVTAGVDTQDNRLAVHITGWGRGMACWTLDYIELMGDPADDEVWVALTDLLNRPIEHEYGGVLRAQAVAIDGGGHRTEAVKNFVRARRVRRPMVIFGAKPNNAPVISRGKMQDVNYRGKLDKRGVKIFHVGTVAIKHWLYGRLSTDADKPREQRLVHLSEDLPPEYFGGLVSETYNPSKNRFEKRRGPRNEPLDTWVYSYAAAHHQELRLHRYTRKDWDAAEARLRTQDDSDAAAAQSIETPTATRQRRKPQPQNHGFGSDEWQL